jgi:protein-disulfide isomerase-like protein with CxxC motif
VEVVFLSADRDEASFKQYLAEMPWLALSFADIERLKALNSVLEVDGYPTLVVIDEAGKVSSVIQDYLIGRPFLFKILIIGIERIKSLNSVLEVDGYPTLVVIDEAGKVSWVI